MDKQIEADPFGSLGSYHAMRYLTNKELKANIEWLQNHFNKEPTHENVAHSFKRICDKFGGAISDWTHKTTFRNHYFFRARKVADVSEVEKCLPSSFSYPPANIVRLGRANIARHPVFYASDMPLEAIVETDVDYLTKRFYVACWKFTGELKYLKYLYHSEGTGKRIADHFELAYETIKKDHPLHSRESHRRMHDLLKEISLLFLHDSHVLSSIISHHKLYNQSLVDGIAYSGVKSLQGINYALCTEVADKMTIERVFLYAFENGNVVIEEIGELFDSRILWRKPQESDVLWNPDGLLRLDEKYTAGRRPISTTSYGCHNQDAHN